MNPPANQTKSLRDDSRATLVDTSATLVPQGLGLVSRRIDPPACPARATADVDIPTPSSRARDGFTHNTLIPHDGVTYNTIIPRESAAIPVGSQHPNAVIPRESAGSIRQPGHASRRASIADGRGMDPGFRRDDGVGGEAVALPHGFRRDDGVVGEAVARAG